MRRWYSIRWRWRWVGSGIVPDALGRREGGGCGSGCIGMALVVAVVAGEGVTCQEDDVRYKPC